MQWGSYSHKGVQDQKITFTITFSTACYSVMTIDADTSTSGAQGYGVSSFTSSYFMAAGYGCSPTKTTYIAIGQ